jgi:hypothetical protein
MLERAAKTAESRAFKHHEAKAPSIYFGELLSAVVTILKLSAG